MFNKSVHGRALKTSFASQWCREGGWKKGKNEIPQSCLIKTNVSPCVIIEVVAIKSRY